MKIHSVLAFALLAVRPSSVFAAPIPIVVHEPARGVADLIRQWERHAQGLPNSLNARPDLAVVPYNSQANDLRSALKKNLAASKVENKVQVSTATGRLDANKADATRLTRTGRFVPRTKNLSPRILSSISALNSAAPFSEVLPANFGEKLGSFFKTATKLK